MANEINPRVREIIEHYTKQRRNLIPILERVQEAEEYLSEDVIRAVGHYLDLSINDVYSVASFYTRFCFAKPEDGAAAGTEVKTCDTAVRDGEVRIALRNVGLLDPEKIDDYKAIEGYAGLAKALKMTSEELIDEVGKSGLRGRGGAGFPVADKWRVCRSAPGKDKYVICDAAEGDPDACAAKVLLENDPHAVLEGMVIAAYAIGAGNGIVYVNGEYTVAISRLKNAISQMEAQKFLGEGVCGSPCNFTITVFEGAGAIVAGEESALIRSLEGKRAMPQKRPLFPAVSGFLESPTLINSAETFADVSAIFLKGVDWFAGIGTGSKGTKILTLAGDIARPGVVEVPMGTTIRKVIEMGGGVAGGKKFKAVRVGGITGGWLAESYLDTTIDFESLKETGAIMGSGSLVVADSDKCTVNAAKQGLSLIETESCGKCVFCREGSMQLAEILTDITEGRAKANDVDILVEVGEGMAMNSFCNFGKTAANPVLTTIRDFRTEYEAHVKDRTCPAGVCKIVLQ